MKARQAAPAIDAGLARFDPTPDRPGLPGHEVENVRLRFLLWADRRRYCDLPAHPDGRSFTDLQKLHGDDLDAAIRTAINPRSNPVSTTHKPVSPKAPVDATPVNKGKPVPGADVDQRHAAQAARLKPTAHPIPVKAKK